MVRAKVLNSNNNEIPSQPLHILTLHPYKLLALEQVLQQFGKHKEALFLIAKLKQDLDEGREGTNTDSLHGGDSTAELETDGEYPINNTKIEIMYKTLIIKAKSYL